LNRTAASFQTSVGPVLERDVLVAERLRQMIDTHVGVAVGHLNQTAVCFQRADISPGHA